MTTEELVSGDHILMPNPATNAMDIWLICSTFKYTSNKAGVACEMISLDLLGPQHLRIHCFKDQQWQVSTLNEWESR